MKARLVCCFLAFLSFSLSFRIAAAVCPARAGSLAYDLRPEVRGPGLMFRCQGFQGPAQIKKPFRSPKAEPARLSSPRIQDYDKYREMMIRVSSRERAWANQAFAVSALEQFFHSRLFYQEADVMSKQQQRIQAHLRAARFRFVHSFF